VNNQGGSGNVGIDNAGEIAFAGSNTGYFSVYVGFTNETGGSVVLSPNDDLRLLAGGHIGGTISGDGILELFNQTNYHLEQGLSVAPESGIAVTQEAFLYVDADVTVNGSFFLDYGSTLDLLATTLTLTSGDNTIDGTVAGGTVLVSGPTAELYFDDQYMTVARNASVQVSSLGTLMLQQEFKNDGSIGASNHGNVDFSGNVETDQGDTGAIAVGGSSVLTFGGMVDAAQTVTFTDSTGLVVLAYNNIADTGQEFLATFAGFQATTLSSDTIDIENTVGNSGNTVSVDGFSNGVLTLFDSDGNTTLKLACDRLRR
jgi:hypothetical protein